VDVTELGRRGGTATAAARTPQQRSDAARKAVQARWERYRKAKRGPKGRAVA
jgi:general stress protein YciG